MWTDTLELLRAEEVSERKEEREGATDEVVVEARSYVHVRRLADDGRVLAPEEVYLLDTMDSEEYEKWYTERDTLGPNEDGEVSPLPIPDNFFVIQGLKAHVLTRYLDPDQPREINQIRSHLDGPLIEDDQYLAPPLAS